MWHLRSKSMLNGIRIGTGTVWKMTILLLRIGKLFMTPVTFFNHFGRSHVSLRVIAQHWTPHCLLWMFSTSTINRHSSSLGINNKYLAVSSQAGTSLISIINCQTRVLFMLLHWFFILREEKPIFWRIGQDPGIKQYSTVPRNYGKIATRNCQVRIRYLSSSRNQFRTNMNFLLGNWMLWVQIVILMNMKPSPHKFQYQLTVHHSFSGFATSSKAIIWVYRRWQLIFFQFLLCLLIQNVSFPVHGAQYHGTECSLGHL